MKPARMPHIRIKIRPWYYSWRIQPSRHRDEAAALSFEKEANGAPGSSISDSVLGSPHDFEAQGTGSAALGTEPVVPEELD